MNFRAVIKQRREDLRVLLRRDKVVGRLPKNPRMLAVKLAKIVGRA